MSVKIAVSFTIGDGYNTVLGRTIERTVALDRPATYDNEPNRDDHYDALVGVVGDLLAELADKLYGGEVESELSRLATDAITKWHRHDPERSRQWYADQQKAVDDANADAERASFMYNALAEQMDADVNDDPIGE